jgi:CarD family transcriptional regulator
MATKPSPKKQPASAKSKGGSASRKPQPDRKPKSSPVKSAPKPSPAKTKLAPKAAASKKALPAKAKAPSPPPRATPKPAPAKSPPKTAAAPAKKEAAAKAAPAPKTAPKSQAADATKSKGAKPAATVKLKPQAPVKKKLHVGQKPRAQKPSEAIITTVPLNSQKAFSPVSDSVVKASPPSAQAKQEFKVNDHIVYPAHGVGRIVAIEKQLIAGVTNELFLIDFEQEKMKLRVPTGKAKAVGMRPLSEPSLVKKAVETLK